MATLVLEKKEFTVETLLNELKKKFGSKNNAMPFSKADIHDWTTKGRIPRYYGGQFIRVQKVGPLKVLELSSIPFVDNEERKIQIEKKDGGIQ